MINELYPLLRAMDRAGIAAQDWHRKYKPIPNINSKSPCLHIVLSEGKIDEISALSQEQGACIRKYGSNQGTFNACNLVPLYRVTDEDVKKRIAAIKATPTDEIDIHLIRSWCTHHNWCKSFKEKYKISVQSIPDELRRFFALHAPCPPMLQLMDEIAPFTNPQTLYQALETYVFQMLNLKTDVALALHILFHLGSEKKEAQKDMGTLSVVFDSKKLINEGTPAASDRFTRQFNQALMDARESDIKEGTAAITDAFGFPFTPLEEPMPTVKLAGGFEVTLRTMFGATRCQTRYHRTDNASYPIAPSVRLKLQTALDFMGDKAHAEKTWVSINKNEILFAYPHTLPKTSQAYILAFKRQPNLTLQFEKEAEALVSALRGANAHPEDIHASRLSIFILRKIDKARVKTVYSRVTNAAEFQQRAIAWTHGCQNVPPFSFGQPQTPFPIDIADTLNRAWKQNGMPATDKFEPIPHYRGMQLMMEKDEPVTQDLALLAKSCMALSAYLGKTSVTDRAHHGLIWKNAKEMAALCGLMLDRLDVRKEQYMKDFPYLYGQLLKISDEIHALYCKVVRENDIPQQFAGSGLVGAAAEAPIRTLHLLGQRMMPYVTWAKSYRYQEIKEEGVQSWRAGWLMNLYESAATALYAAWTPLQRFNDAEKAQLFLGYIAALPKKDKPDNAPKQSDNPVPNDDSNEEESIYG